MEKEGIVRTLEDIRFHGIEINTLTTARHTQLRKILREKPHLKSKHQFDVWHMSKGIKKKLTSASNKPYTKELQKCIESIINHF